MPRGSFNSASQGIPSGAGMSVHGRDKFIEGSDEQVMIWEALLDTHKHVIVKACAGSGKTTTIVQYALRERNKTVVLVAFNKHIEVELAQRIGAQGNVQCMTYHGLGYRTVRNAVGALGKVNDYRVFDLLDTMHMPVEDKHDKIVKYRIKSVVSIAKQYGLMHDCDVRALEGLVEYHDIDLEGFDEIVYEYTPKVLKKCLEVRRGDSIDFDDMVWLPFALGLKVPRFDVICVDEYQDTGMTQQWLAVQGGERVCAVGDVHQSIYGFRGADAHGFERLAKTLGEGNVIELPLALTRRCAKSHVRLANVLVKEIRAMEDAPEGVIRLEPDIDVALGQMTPGDLVLCRVNAPLVGCAYKLLRRGVKAMVRGKNIGEGLVRLIEHAEREARRAGDRVTHEKQTQEQWLRQVMVCADTITRDQVAKFTAIHHGRGMLRASAAQDKFDCLVELACHALSVDELIKLIQNLFGEVDADGRERRAVVLGSVHRSKGLEGDRVWVLKPELIPHPNARQAHDIEQEKHLAYVAVTRVKARRGEDGETIGGELVFVGGECPFFPPISGMGVRVEPNVQDNVPVIQALDRHAPDTEIEELIEDEHTGWEILDYEQRSSWSV